MPAFVGAQAVGRTQVRCDGQRVSEVVVRSQAPSLGSIVERSGRISRALSRFHPPTNPEVITSLVLLRPGARCNALRRSESERLLRAMPFIADATVTAYADGPNSVRIEVVTIDEPSFLGGVGAKNEFPYLTRVIWGNGNLLGDAVHLSTQWRQGFEFRDVFAARYTNYQLFGRPYQLDVRGGRRELGSDWSMGVSLPFLTDVQRTAWRVEGGRTNEYARFRRRVGPDLTLPVYRTFFDAGMLARVGPPLRSGALGLQLTSEAMRPAVTGYELGPHGLAPDTSDAFAGRYSPQRSVRINALLGMRFIRFSRVQGFDAVSAPQDVATGLQVGGVIGTALPGSSGTAKGEEFLGGSAFAGVGGESGYLALQIDMDGRHQRSGGWEDVFSSGRAALYRKPSEGRLFLADITWGAGWRTRVPYQLSLGDRRGGLLAFKHSWLAGGRRVTGRLEERRRVFESTGNATAVSVFAEGGTVREGDAVLGASSGLRASLGASLLLALPARSQRTWRVEIAAPVSKRSGGGTEFRIINEDRTRFFWSAPPDIRRTRERAIPSSVFAWP